MRGGDAGGGRLPSGSQPGPGGASASVSGHHLARQEHSGPAGTRSRDPLLGQTFAIDFAAVDELRRTSAVRDWRTLVAMEPAERFFAFGAPILAPAGGRVIAVHDDEPDHPARRSPLTLVPDLLTQGSRLRPGLSAVVGNHLILGLDENGPYVVLAHLRAGSVRVTQSPWVTRLLRVATRETRPSRSCTRPRA